ncbi:MAG: DNA adenine methylase [Patescibacteria group bacterium]
MRVISPLRYAGSKRKLFNYLERILVHNYLQPKMLVEPFVGGGSIFLNFLSNHKRSKAIIADKDELVYSFWKTLFTEPTYLINFIKRVKVSLRTFDKYKYISSHPNKFNRKKLAEACIFLNRTSFSGILNNSAGPIGGRTQKSTYKIDCRFGRKNLIERIKDVSALKNRVTILPYDWEHTVNYLDRKSKYKNDDVLVYLDPPFYRKADQLYRHHFDIVDHVKLRDALMRLGHSWILSYDRTEEIQNLYSAFARINVSMPYSINSPAKRLEKEFIITPLKLPRIK